MNVIALHHNSSVKPRQSGPVGGSALILIHFFNLFVRWKTTTSRTPAAIKEHPIIPKVPRYALAIAIQAM
jgi:hypothetical protein